MPYSMENYIPLENIEQDQKFDDSLVQKIAKFIEILSNLED
jgi:hypothetical protein